MLDRELEAPPVRTSRLRRLLAPIAIGVVVIAWAAFIWGQIDALRALAWQASPALLAAAVLLGAIYYVVLAFCWALLLRRMRAQAVPFVPAVRVWLFSMVSRDIPGNVWHILSRARMAQQLGVSRTAVVSSASIEQVLTILAAFSVAALTMPAWQTTTGQALDPMLATTIVVATLIGLVCLHPRIFGRLLAAVGTRLGRPDMTWQYRYVDILIITAVFAVAHVCSGLALATVTADIVEIDGAQLPLIIGAASAAWALGYLSLLTPSGLGVREGVLTGLLALALPLPAATIASLLFRVTITFGELLAVALFWIGGLLARAIGPK